MLGWREEKSSSDFFSLFLVHHSATWWVYRLINFVFSDKSLLSLHSIFSFKNEEWIFFSNLTNFVFHFYRMLRKEVRVRGPQMYCCWTCWSFKSNNRETFLNTLQRLQTTLKYDPSEGRYLADMSLLIFHISKPKKKIYDFSISSFPIQLSNKRLKVWHAAHRAKKRSVNS